MSQLGTKNTGCFNAPATIVNSWDGSVTDEDMSRICQLMHRWAGVTLESSKSYLVQNRLANMMRERELTRLGDLLSLAERQENAAIRNRIIDAMTTHETLFFRDGSPFQAISKHLIPDHIKKSSMRPSLKIWSAGCSSGQEPYSLAMMLIESIPMIHQWDVRITATDVSPGIIDIAKSGVYQKHETTRGLSTQQQTRFFSREGDGYRISDQVRKMVDFKVQSLLDESGPPGAYDLILCRNVLIYFSDGDVRRICKTLAGRLKVGGHFFVGSSEVLHGKTNDLILKRIGGVTVYQAS